ncbi:hypothetical protein [Leisingera sp. M658]|uniref:hypothetical protein n=1 Tax=Leisingera sp. M658 TaxID=2867015 RepID=UPI0021A76541|nr:hypothetical protein [Leisingera sp. M658]UWQ73605.1 hypothetical protein K3724_13725 [Leisingera sp. M658]
MRGNLFATIFCFALGVVIAAIPILASEHPDFGHLNSSEYWAIFLLLGVLIAGIPPIFRIFSILQDQQSKVDDLLLSNLERSFVGHAPESEKVFYKDVEKATTVQNTSVALRSLDKADRRSLKVCYQKWLRRRDTNSWEDLVSIRELYSSRFTDISVSNYTQGKHRVFVLRDGVTPMNFTILKGLEGGKKQAVYFGWLPTQSREKTKLFKSTDEGIVELFCDYFDILKQHSWNGKLDPSDANHKGFTLNHEEDEKIKLNVVSPSVVDKKGQWMTVAFNAGADGDMEQVHSIAFLTINFTGPNVTLTPVIYDVKGGRLPDFSTVDASFFKNNIYFNYRVESRSSYGICHYQFFRHDTLGSTIRGVFCDNASNKRHSLLGIPVKFDENTVRGMRERQFRMYVDQAREKFEHFEREELKTLIAPTS